MFKKASGVDDDEYERVKRYVLTKARRYGLPTVHLSDVQTYLFNDEQLQRLYDDVAAAGFQLKLGHHVHGLDFVYLKHERTVERFGDHKGHH